MDAMKLYQKHKKWLREQQKIIEDIINKEIMPKGIKMVFEEIKTWKQ